MKLALTLLLSMAAAALASPSDPLTVAVYDFKGTILSERHAASKVMALVAANLTTNPAVVMLERAELNKALNEQAFGISGMVSSDAAARIGALTGAKVLVTGQVLITATNHLVIIGNIIGTETGRLFSSQVEGPANHLVLLTEELSRKIAQTIVAHREDLVAASEESHAARLKRIVESIHGTNRPTVSVAIDFYSDQGTHWRDNYAEYEFGAVLLKAGFTVLDENSDRKPDIEITGDASTGRGSQQGDLVSDRTAIEVKVQERRSGKIIAFDREEGVATGIGKSIVGRTSHINAVDGLAERILPLLAK